MSTRARRGGALVSCFVAAALFGASTPATKGLATRLDPQLLAGLLYLGAALAVAPGALRKGWGRLSRRQGLRVAGAIVAGGGIAPVLLMAGLARAASASVALWLPLETVWTALLAWAFFHENLDRRGWWAMLLVTAAGAALAWGERTAGGSAALLVALACLGWALDNNLTAGIDALTPTQLTLLKGLVAGGVNLAVGWWRAGALPSAGDGALALGIGALGYGVSLALYIGAQQQLGAARSQMLFAAAPFVGVLLSWAALHEAVQPAQLLGCLLLAGAFALLFVERHQHEHTHEELEHTHWHRHDDAHHEHVHPGLPPGTGHSHPHTHAPVTHVHPHWPDLHHRHH